MIAKPLPQYISNFCRLICSTMFPLAFGLVLGCGTSDDLAAGTSNESSESRQKEPESGRTGANLKSPPAPTSVPFRQVGEWTPGYFPYGPVVLSPDERLLLVQSQLFELESGRELPELPFDYPDNATISRDGTWIAACKNDKLKLVNRDTSETRKHEFIQSACFAPHIDQLAMLTADGEEVRILDVASNRILRTIDLGFEEPADYLCFLPDGKKLLTGARLDPVRIWELNTGDEVSLPADRDDLMTHPLAFSPNGEMVVEGYRKREIQIRRTSDWKEQFRVKLPSYANQFRFSADGRQLWVQCRGDLCVIDVPSQKLTEYTRLRENAIGAAFRSDGSEAFVVLKKQIAWYQRGDHKSFPNKPIAGTTPAMRLDHSQCYHTAFTQDAQSIIEVSGTKAVLRDVATGQKQSQLPAVRNYTNAIDVHIHDSVLYRPNRNGIDAVSLTDGTQAPPIEFSEFDIFGSGFSDGGQLAAVTGSKGELRLLNIQTRNLLGRLNFPKEIESVAIAPHDAELALLTGDAEESLCWLKRYSLPDLQELAAYQMHYDTQHVIYSPDGRWLATLEHGTLVIRETKTGRQAAFVRDVNYKGFGFTNDSRYIFAIPDAGEFQDKVALYDVTTGFPVHYFIDGSEIDVEAHDELNVSPDGRYLTLLGRGGLYWWPVPKQFIAERADLAEPSKNDQHESPKPEWHAPKELRELVENNPPGSRFVFRVTGSTNGRLIGTDSYAAHSDLAKAVVHAGLAKDGEEAIVVVTVKAGQTSYRSTTRNGVRSYPFRSFPAGFTVDGYRDNVDIDSKPMANGQKYILQLRPRVGKTYEMAHVTQVFGGTPGRFEASRSYLVNIQKQFEDNIEMQVKYRRVRLINEDAGIAYDSLEGVLRRPNPRPDYDALIGQSLTVYTNAHGKITKIERVEDLARRQYAANPIPNANRADRDREVKLFAENLRGEWSERFIHYPSSPVAIGDSWKGTLQSSDGISFRRTYTLRKIDDETAVIEIRGKSFQGQKIAGDHIGQLKLDRATGWVLDGKIQSDVAWTTEHGTTNLRLIETHHGKVDVED